MVKFKDFSRPLSVFQVQNLIFKEFSKQSCIFKYFSILREPCVVIWGREKREGGKAGCFTAIDFLLVFCLSSLRCHRLICGVFV